TRRPGPAQRDAGSAAPNVDRPPQPGPQPGQAKDPRGPEDLWNLFKNSAPNRAAPVSPDGAEGGAMNTTPAPAAPAPGPAAPVPRPGGTTPVRPPLRPDPSRLSTASLPADVSALATRAGPPGPHALGRSHHANGPGDLPPDPPRPFIEIAVGSASDPVLNVW